MAKANLTAEYVREALHYDPETGEFTWKVRPREHFETKSAHGTWNTRFAGTRAGSLNGDGYLQIKLQSCYCRAHRLAFLIMTGEFPSAHVDHIDRNPSNNRWQNLRPATRTENMRNAKRRQDNVSGHTGVDWQQASRKWRARITVDRKRIHLGHWASIGMATLIRKYSEAYYGYGPNHGR